FTWASSQRGGCCCPNETEYFPSAQITGFRGFLSPVSFHGTILRTLRSQSCYLTITDGLGEYFLPILKRGRRQRPPTASSVIVMKFFQCPNDSPPSLGPNERWRKSPVVFPTGRKTVTMFT